MYEFKTGQSLFYAPCSIDSLIPFSLKRRVFHMVLRSQHMIVLVLGKNGCKLCQTHIKSRMDEIWIKRKKPTKVIAYWMAYIVFIKIRPHGKKVGDSSDNLWYWPDTIWNMRNHWNILTIAIIKLPIGVHGTHQLSKLSWYITFRIPAVTFRYPIWFIVTGEGDGNW